MFKNHYLNCICAHAQSSTFCTDVAGSLPLLASRGDGDPPHKATLRTDCQGLPSHPAFSAPTPSWKQSLYRRVASSRRDSDTVLARTAASHPLCARSLQRERRGLATLTRTHQSNVLLEGGTETGMTTPNTFPIA